MAPYHHPACLPEAELLKQCTVTTGRAGGPGGQHRNKVETHVELLHPPSGLHSQAGERRSQVENKHEAVERLRLLLAVNVRTAPRVRKGLALLDEPGGSELWRSRVRGKRIILNPDHHDYPSMLAEALDTIAHCGWEPSRAAVLLDTSASQLIKLAKYHPPALLHWNAQRAERGLHPLK